MFVVSIKTRLDVKIWIMETEIIVIGAGAAGLAAALELGKAGKSVAVLEARSRIGGRIYTLPQNARETAPIELGAEFVHGVAPEIFDVCQRADLKIVETAGKSWCVNQDQVLQLCDELPETGEDKIWQEIKEFDQADLSLQDFSANRFSDAKMSAARNSFLHYAAGFHAADTSRAGVLGIARAERAADNIEGDRAFRFAHGYAEIPRYLYNECLRQKVEFHFDCAVKKVTWQLGKVTIEVAGTKNQTQIFKAQRAVVTLPLGVLKAAPESDGAVSFEPELKEKQSCLERLEMGNAVRVVLRFRRDWWTERLNANGESEKLGFLIAANQPFTAWWTAQPIADTILTAWTGGDNARIFEGRDADSVKNQAIESLAQVFKIEKSFVENELQAAYFHDWQTDRFARGAYSYVGVAGINAGAELARPLADTLFFAGEATDSEGHLGTVHGAISSGIRAAREITAARFR